MAKVSPCSVYGLAGHYIVDDTRVTTSRLLQARLPIPYYGARGSPAGMHFLTLNMSTISSSCCCVSPPWGFLVYPDGARPTGVEIAPERDAPFIFWRSTGTRIIAERSNKNMRHNLTRQKLRRMFLFEGRASWVGECDPAVVRPLQGAPVVAPPSF